MRIRVVRHGLEQSPLRTGPHESHRNRYSEASSANPGTRSTCESERFLHPASSSLSSLHVCPDLLPLADLRQLQPAISGLCTAVDSIPRTVPTGRVRPRPAVPVPIHTQLELPGRENARLTTTRISSCSRPCGDHRRCRLKGTAEAYLVRAASRRVRLCLAGCLASIRTRNSSLSVAYFLMERISRRLSKCSCRRNIPTRTRLCQPRESSMSHRHGRHERVQRVPWDGD